MAFTKPEFGAKSPYKQQATQWALTSISPCIRAYASHGRRRLKEEATERKRIEDLVVNLAVGQSRRAHGIRARYIWTWAEPKLGSTNTLSRARSGYHYGISNAMPGSRPSDPCNRRCGRGDACRASHGLRNRTS